MKRIFWITLVPLLASCASDPSPSHSSNTDSSFPSSVSSESSYVPAWSNIKDDDLPYAPPRYLDGIYIGHSLEDLRTLRGQTGDIYVNQNNGIVAAWLGEEALSTGKVPSEWDYGWWNGWHIVSWVHGGLFGKMLHFDEEGPAHTIEAALFRSAYAMNGTLDGYDLASYDKDITTVYHAELSLGAFHQQYWVRHPDGSTSSTDTLGWVENGVPSVRQNEVFRSGNNGQTWQFYLQTRPFLPSVFGGFDYVAFLDLAEPLATNKFLISHSYEGEMGTLYELSIEFTLTTDLRYVTCIDGHLRKTYETLGTKEGFSYLRFSRFGDTTVAIPDETL